MNSGAFGLVGFVLRLFKGYFDDAGPIWCRFKSLTPSGDWVGHGSRTVVLACRREEQAWRFCYILEPEFKGSHPKILAHGALGDSRYLQREQAEEERCFCRFRFHVVVFCFFFGQS